jgi:hypothetical protein
MACAVFFLFRPFRLRRQGTLATNLFVHLQEGPAQLLKRAELGNLTFRLAPRGRTGEGFAHRLALYLVGQAEVGAMAGMVRVMTMTVGLAAAGGDTGDRTTAEVTELRDLAEQLGPLALEDVQGWGHVQGLLSPNVSYTLG